MTQVENSSPMPHKKDYVVGLSGRLLVYEASQGWNPLCRFLGVPVPEAPFPRVNSREEMSAMMASQDAGDPERCVRSRAHARSAQGSFWQAIAIAVSIMRA